MKKIAVVILNWNGASMLRQFLPFVINNSTEANIYVADNNSTDDSVEVVTKEFSNVKLIILDKNYGFAEGYNRALSNIEEEYSVLLNSDVEVSKDWLQPMLQYMEIHKEVVACQPKIRSYRKREEFEYAGACGGFIDKYGYPYCRGRIMGHIEKDMGQYDKDVVDIFWATGAALMIRTNIYKEVGGLDGTFFAHMEEIDLCWRLRSRGYHIVCIPYSTVYHVGGATLKKENPHKTFLNFRNNLLMLYKNLSEEELCKVMRIRLILDYIAATKFILTGDISNFKAVLKARTEFKKIKSSYKIKREENLEQTKCKTIREKADTSILFEYYIKGIRTFSSLSV